MGLRGRIVRGLDRGEEPVPCVPLDEMRDAPARLSGRDAENHVVPKREALETIRGTRIERFGIGRVPSQLGEGLPVGLGQTFDRRLRAGQRRKGLDERQANDRQGSLPARRLQAVRRKGDALGRDDDVLTVDEGAVDVEEDELHGSRIERIGARSQGAGSRGGTHARDARPEDVFRPKPRPG
jgi:hypothetical protein